MNRKLPQNSAATAEDSYARIVRMAMKTAANPTGEVLTIRDVARRTGYSYEHVRRTFNGDTHYISADFNRRMCKALGLNENEMWQIAVAEKMAARFGAVTPAVTKGNRFDSLWAQLGAREHRVLERIASALLEER